MISNDFIFISQGSKLVCWNFKEHKQYELSAAHAMRLIDLIHDKSNALERCQIDADFERCQLISHNNSTATPWGWDILSRVFHYGTKNLSFAQQPGSESEWARLYTEHCESAYNKPFPAPKATSQASCKVKLTHSSLNAGLCHTLNKRSTARQFTKAPIKLEELSTLLEHTLGFIERRTLNDHPCTLSELQNRRSSPSSGGLNSIEGYVFINNIEYLEQGLYYYDPLRHELHRCGITKLKLSDLLSGQNFVNTLPVGLFLTSRLDKLWWKYEHSRAYRMALIEVGHVAQTFQLLATALGLSTWITGAFNEAQIEPLLTLSPHEELLFFVGCGHSTGSATPNCLQ